MGWFDERRRRKEAEQALRAELESVMKTKNVYSLVIFKAYNRMEMNLERYYRARQDPETVRQYMIRMVAALPLDRIALADFQSIFEQARYSVKVFGEAERGVAINSLRAVQYSLEKLGPPKKMVAPGTDGPSLAGAQPPVQQHPKHWVVPPPVSTERKIAAGPVLPHVPVAPAEVAGLCRMFGPPNPAPEGLPAESIEEMKLAAAGWKWARLGELVESAVAGPAGKCRLHLDITFARYMLEFGRILKEAGKAGADPPWDAHRKWLAAAQVLALAEGRDYLVPDDLKVAMLLGFVAKGFHITAAEALPVLDRTPLSIDIARYAWPVDIPAQES